MRSRLPQVLSLVLLVTCIDAAPGVADYRPHAARSPQQAPTNPPRNKTIFTAQICGLVGGYIATVLIWGILLLTVGRRMRNRTHESPKALELELVNARPSGRALASPLSARSATSWFKKGFTKKSESIRDSAVGSPESPAIQSPGSFDQKVIEADRDRAQAEMERLYAAVMEHDRKKSFSQTSNAGDEIAEVADKRPSRIDTNVSRETTTQSNPTSPMRAIYPPGYQNGPPTAPLPRSRDQQQPPASPRSILSKKSHMSSTSNSSRARFNLKNLRISGPIQKYPTTNNSDDEEARTPLSPRFYNPGAPPSPPSQMNTPTTPGDIEEAYEQLDEPQPLPRPAPQRLGSYASYSQTSPTSATTPTQTSNNLPTKSANSSSHELPLRGYSEPLRSPDLRTTVLDRKKDKLNMMAAARTPGTAPGTGGVPYTPYTPYSPYMPFTPVTPVTPHLVTKSDRKNMKKAYGRRMKAREQLVQTPKEIFGDAY